MALMYGELLRAQLQSSASDLTPVGAGLIYWNTTSLFAKIYNGSTWKTLVDSDSAQDLGNKDLLPTSAFKHSSGTARMKVDLAGASSTFTSTLDFNHTADRTYTFPNVTGDVFVTGDAVLDDLFDVSVAAPQDGQALVYSASGTNWIAGASGDASFKVQSVAAVGTIVIKGGYIIDSAGKEYATYDGAGNNSTDFGGDLTFDLDTIITPVDNTTYFLYIDTTLLAAQVTLTDNGRELYRVTSSHFVGVTTTPDSIDLSRYIPIGFVRRGVGADSWSTTLFGTFATRRHDAGSSRYAATFTSTPSATIAHGLAGIPKFISILHNNDADGRYDILDVGSYIEVDATNLYIENMGDLTIDGTHPMIITALL
jgi:hypothetical protein